MDEYITLLHDMLRKAKAQVVRNNEYRHGSHNDYADGVADGLQQAYDLLTTQVVKDLKKHSDTTAK